MNRVRIQAAKRTPVAPRGGALRDVEVWALAAPLIRNLLSDTHIDAGAVDAVIMGNALYAGGNPARLSALAAGLPDTVAAFTLDTQCCAGLDAISLGFDMIASGRAHVVIAGGFESFSRAPLRARKPGRGEHAPVPYARPPFSPWPERDPDLIDAAAALASERGVARETQAAFAIESHRKARLDAGNPAELVAIEGLERDAFPRQLNAALCARAPVLAGDEKTGVCTATVAVEADAAAAVLLVADNGLMPGESGAQSVQLIDAVSIGGDPAQPARVPVAATRALCQRHVLDASDVHVVEVMEAFAIQAMTTCDELGLVDERVNRGGGALARGHPIGASGAILAVRLWHELQREEPGALGLATIAAAGGLGSTVLMERP